MNILSKFTSQQEAGSTFVEAENLGSLWAKAEQLGRVEVDCSIFTGSYTAKIRFENKNGSYISAQGSGIEVFDALTKAVDEAIALGARPAPRKLR